MRTAELIRRLQEADPSGEIEVVVGVDDIHFVSVDPFYYDGTPFLLERDLTKEGRCYNIVGAREMTSGQKVKIHTLGLEDILCNDPDAPIVCTERRAKMVDETRSEMKRIHEK